jgi:hypothetical protein
MWIVDCGTEKKGRGETETRRRGEKQMRRHGDGVVLKFFANLDSTASISIIHFRNNCSQYNFEKEINNN